MCLVTNKEKQVATEDIKVYKLLTPNYQAPYYDFQYKKGKLYKTEIKESNVRLFFSSNDSRVFDKLSFEKQECCKFYGQGFHSLTTLDFATKEQGRQKYIIVECIVPKGAEYIIGLTDVMISNQIFIGGKGRRFWSRLRGLFNFHYECSNRF